MANVPALCKQCGILFDSGINIENSTSVIIHDSTAGPCPSCGSELTIPDLEIDDRGRARFVEEAYHVLRSAGLSRDELHRLITLLSNASMEGASAEEIADEIAAQFPLLDLSRLIWDMLALPQLQGIGAVIAITHTLITLASFLMSHSSPPETLPFESPIIINHSPTIVVQNNYYDIQPKPEDNEYPETSTMPDGEDVQTLEE